MSVKITLVENHINRNFKQYNIDEFTIKENFGSIEKFKSILSKKRSKEDEANLIAFLSEIRPINKIIDMRKTINKQLSIKDMCHTITDLLKKINNIINQINKLLDDCYWQDYLNRINITLHNLLSKYKLKFIKFYRLSKILFFLVSYCSSVKTPLLNN